MPRIWITGPAGNSAEYATAARSVGWEPLELALVHIEAVDVDLVPLATQNFDALCITSSNALPFVERLIHFAPALRRLRCFAVGVRTRERAQALGLPLAGELALDARELAEQVLHDLPRAQRVLWPRGDQSDDLAFHLRVNKIEVEDPIVYATRSLAATADVPAADAVFFASPSAVRTWSARAHAPASARIAIAIGRTTFDALMRETSLSFRDTLVLAEPTSAALAHALAHIDATP